MVRVLKSVLLVVAILGFIASSNADATDPGKQVPPAGNAGGQAGGSGAGDGSVDGNIPPEVLQSMVGGGKGK